MNFLPEKKYGVPSHNFVKKNVLWEKGDEITRFDGTMFLHVRTFLGFLRGFYSFCNTRTRQKKVKKG